MGMIVRQQSPAAEKKSSDTKSLLYCSYKKWRDETHRCALQRQGAEKLSKLDRYSKQVSKYLHY